MLIPRSGWNHDFLKANEVAFKNRCAIFQQHGDHFLKIGLQLFQGFRLAVGTRESRYVAHQEARFLAALNHR